MAPMKWYHLALVGACVLVGAVIGVVVSRMFHVTILAAPVLAAANGVSVYFMLRRKIDAQVLEARSAPAT